MACSGNCTIQEFEVRNKNYDDVDLNPPIQPGCRPSPPFNNAQQAVFNAIDNETKPVSDGCEDDCQCVKIANQDPPWTEWASATIEVDYALAGCTWKLKGSYEYRTRQFQGLCGPSRSMVAAAFIPDFEVELVAKTPFTGDQITRITEVLKGEET